MNRKIQLRTFAAFAKNRFKFSATTGLALIAVSVFFGCSNSETSEASDEPIKYLGIGNSFTWNSTEYLDEIVASEDSDLEFFVAGIGGSSLETHVQRMKLNERDPEDPEGRPYLRSFPDPDRGAVGYSLKEILQQEQWDYVSIQQVSLKSFKPETYEPFAGELIAIIREFAPQAEILVHMTWAYREDHHWFVNGERTQKEMFDGLAAAYRELAERYDLRIIPIGEAVQQARSMETWSFSFPDPSFNYRSATPPDLPKQEGSLNVGWHWGTSKESGEQELRLDATHLNAAGCYLGGLTQFEFLTGEAVSDDVFRPEGLSAAQAESLRDAAHRAAQDYQSFNQRLAKAGAE